MITRSYVSVARFGVVLFVSQFPQFFVMQSYYINDYLAIIIVVGNIY